MPTTENHSDKYILVLSKQFPDLRLSDEDKIFLKKAYTFGEKKHQGQLRASGDSYFTNHCVNVSYKIAGLGFGLNAIVAGLLHDTLEDTNTTRKELSQIFGKAVAGVVDGVTKLSKIKYRGNDRYVENLRKFFLTIAKDVDVVIVKLCDRWHNLETIQYLSEEKRQRIAKESLLIHAQLASRLGMGELFATINNLSFPVAYPKEYKRTVALMVQQLRGTEELISKIYDDLHSLTGPVLGYQPVIDRRIKGVFSLYKKLESKGWNINEIYDLIAFRIIVKTVPDCYVALGTIHSHFRPVPGRVKDYIALPKPNGYKSLHTAIFCRGGPIIEIQIRTESMHRYDELGIASHHHYKLGQLGDLSSQSAEWFRELEGFQKNTENRARYYRYLTENFFSDRIFVLTPDGDVIDLPKGSTVLDFAYKIHSEIGDTAVFGRINGIKVPLKTRLKNEQIVDIVTGSPKQSLKTRLSWAGTSNAKNIIKKQLMVEK